MWRLPQMHLGLALINVITGKIITVALIRKVTDRVIRIYLAFHEFDVKAVCDELDLIILTIISSRGLGNLYTSMKNCIP